MSESELKKELTEDMKTAMRAKDKPRLGVIRLVMSAIKQREVDERIELTNEDVLAVLDKMVKQRRDSFSQFESAGRTDLAEQEQFELDTLQKYLPEQMDDTALAGVIRDVIATVGASSMKDMGKVMAVLKPKVQGRTDMGAVSQKVKSALTA